MKGMVRYILPSVGWGSGDEGTYKVMVLKEPCKV